MLKSIHLGERARDETAINEGNASMGSAAIEKAREELGSLVDMSIIIVGIGDMGELVARALVNREEDYGDLFVANRTFERASHLADEVDGEPIRFSNMHDYFGEVDIVVSATDAPHLILDKSDLRGHELLILDMATPRDVASSADELSGVALIDIDDLEDLSDSSLEFRREAAERVEEMIDEEIGNLEEQYKLERAQDMLSEMYARAEEIRMDETRRAINRLEELDGVDSDEREVINDLTESIMNKLMSTPTEALKQAAVQEDYDTLRSAAEIFMLGADVEDVSEENVEETS